VTYTRNLAMPTMKYVIPGIPIPLQRPRYRGQAKPYDAQKHHKHEVKNVIESQHGQIPFYTTPVRAHFIFYFPIARTSETRSDQLMHTPHVFRPDLSNLVKFYEDCCEGLLYRDDSIIFEIHAVKMYSDTPRTEIVMVPVDPFEKVIKV
jgi:Holliday junction resolvase RusA-like endonuclease